MIDLSARSMIERPAIDLRYQHFKSEKHGITIIGTWLNDGNDSQPCMVLLHSGRDVRPGKTVPCIIALDQAWRWAFHGEVGDPAHCARLVATWIGTGALPGSVWNQKDRMQVADAVNSRLPDLLAMPPRPRIGTLIIGEASITEKDSGKVIDQREVVNDV